MLSRLVVSQVKHNSYFLVGLALGLWLALAAVPLDDQLSACEPSASAGGLSSSAAGVTDEYEPVREERPMGPGGPAAGRSVQRPRYYTTELGMRGGLLAGALSSAEALEGRAAALNATARLSPALRLFVAAAALPPAARAARPNVVAFTDTREMLKPFHALKYLADNYLEEYDLFFLVSDATFVNARRLSELAARLSVSQDVYMGSVADDDTHYCSLEGGILLSNSVLRAIHGELDWCVRNSYSPHHHENIGRCVLHAAHLPCQPALQGGILLSNSVLRAIHGELDWCVRNSYSPHHHENIGRCVLHAAHLPCQPALQGEKYASVRLAGGLALQPALAAAVTVHPLAEPEHFYQLHAYVSRVYLERAQSAIVDLRARGAMSARRHPRGYRNVTWPAGLRADPGLAPPPPNNRFDHLRWTLFNATHAFMPDDHRTVGTLTGAMRKAVDMVVEEATAWATKRWSAGGASLVEGAWCWQPPYALRYRLLLRLTPTDHQDGPDGPDGRNSGGFSMRMVEAARVLGAARLAPARYVTESGRVHVVLPVPLAGPEAADRTAGQLAAAFLRRYGAVCLQRDANTALVIVLATSGNETAAKQSAVTAVRNAAQALSDKHRNARIDVHNATLPALPEPPSRPEADRAAARAALSAALPRLPRDGLVLLAVPDLEFNEDFLNRVRMNTIQGEQWFLPVTFARYSQYAHPRFVEADGSRPQQNTGRFNLRPRPLLAFYRSDYDAALEAWRMADKAPDAAPAQVLAAAPLRALRAPEPAALLAPRAPPCPSAPLAASAPTRACLRRERDRAFADLDLGARHALAKMLLEMQSEAA